jgi:hypothetical protein
MNCTLLSKCAMKTRHHHVKQKVECTHCTLSYTITLQNRLYNIEVMITPISPYKTCISLGKEQGTSRVRTHCHLSQHQLHDLQKNYIPTLMNKLGVARTKKYIPTVMNTLGVACTHAHALAVTTIVATLSSTL